MKTLLELITIIEWEINSQPRIGQFITMKPRSEARMKLFKRGIMAPSPYEQERLYIE